jgi:hypothetical protein
MQSTSNKVDSVQNKELLWSTLQESGAFAGVPGDQFQRVYAAFDRSVQEASRSMTGSLSDVNKHVIREFVQMLRTSTQQPQNQNQKKKKIEVVYRAEDLQNERASEFDRQFREKQAEMDSFLTLKKPTDVSFKDSELKEDKPIGDEMSRLIANELAARERELVQLKPEDIKRAQQWIGTTDNNGNNNIGNGNNNAPNNNIAIKTELPLITNFAKKSVSFSEEEHEMEHFEPNEKMNELNEFSNKNEKHFEETDFIFSKFKKISEPLTEPNAIILQPDASVSIQQLYNKIIELEERMNAKHDEIMACLNVSASVMQNQFNQ